MTPANDNANEDARRDEIVRRLWRGIGCIACAAVGVGVGLAAGKPILIAASSAMGVAGAAFCWFSKVAETSALVAGSIFLFSGLVILWGA